MNTIQVELKLVRDTERYLVATQGGPEFWFDKLQTSDWRIEDGRLIVTIQEKNWLRRLSAVRDSQPKVETRTRKCLCCSKPFEAERHTFVCSPCKQTESWKMGGTAFVN